MRGEHTTPEEVIGWLRWLDEFQRERNRPPTLGEIADGFDLRFPSAAGWRMNILKDQGLVEWEPGKSRTLQITDKGRALLGATVAV